ncbi:NADH-FMN oxidoreductase RutF, flavin reductase (DIM6/NTAB) family [Salinihabitans flavidus]|uniref:NADH-FMN oxidoreductase RutF, flavin reductase (DIM6/NTAB) family n=1 Tax=Salinihabitans flavidus TaxID=569882 RepID=A0A1H8NC24_9RHOB|nr:flavin reductase family protein [Salinihabitans flavidus]SEO27145.1 NADH-FMN oxidoreductase RutF, flavin reductase (DIM6/NTAB) family [Salinihabitans flavidus]
MFYRPEDGHGLPHNPFNALITPRPIAWISTRDGEGRANLAPYSFFNGTAYVPPQVMFASTGQKPDREGTKDSLANIRETGVFCINVVEEAMRDAMNVTTEMLPREVDEFERAGLEKAECESIDCPRIAGAPASLECRLDQVIRLHGEANYITLGTVTGIQLRDNCLRDGIFDVTTFRPLSRLGYRDYAVVENVFTLARPDD